MSADPLAELTAELTAELSGGIDDVKDLFSLETAILIAFGMTEEKLLSGLPVSNMESKVTASGKTGNDILNSNKAPYTLLAQIINKFVENKLREHDRESGAHDG